jgi:hypothetical protein
MNKMLENRSRLTILISDFLLLPARAERVALTDSVVTLSLQHDGN